MHSVYAELRIGLAHVVTCVFQRVFQVFEISTHPELYNGPQRAGIHFNEVRQN